MSKIAVILFNMGGPDKSESIKPFLFNLFNDPAIINLPKIIRWSLAKYISQKRTPIAKKIYAEIGGKSPILDITNEQAKALEVLLNFQFETRVFVAMRYWHPFTEKTAKDVAAYAPDEIVLLPLYPQFSTATSWSSIKEWKRVALKVGIIVPTYSICCYPNEPGFIKAQTKLIIKIFKEASQIGKPRILFSAHGLPKKLIMRGDPYSKQIECTVSSLVMSLDIKDIDYEVCYQSRIGRMEWIKPYTEDAIMRAAEDGVPLIVVPVAFVSEHSETLVELDIEYRDMAINLGVPGYFRVPTVGISVDFIEGLKNLVNNALNNKLPIISMEISKICNDQCMLCPIK